MVFTFTFFFCYKNALFRFRAYNLFYLCSALPGCGEPLLVKFADSGNKKKTAIPAFAPRLYTPGRDDATLSVSTHALSILLVAVPWDDHHVHGWPYLEMIWPPWFTGGSTLRWDDHHGSRVAVPWDGMATMVHWWPYLEWGDHHGSLVAVPWDEMTTMVHRIYSLIYCLWPFELSLLSLSFFHAVHSFSNFDMSCHLLVKTVPVDEL